MQESERLARDKNASLQLLQKVGSLRLGWGILSRVNGRGVQSAEELGCKRAGVEHRAPVTQSPGSHSSLTLCHSGLAGEGETDCAGKEIPLTHRGQAFPEDYVDPQRGIMIGLAPASGPGGVLGGSE